MNAEQKAGAEGGRVEGEAGLEERQGRGKSPGRGRSSPAGGLGGNDGPRKAFRQRWGRLKVGGCGRRKGEAEERPKWRRHSWRRKGWMKMRGWGQEEQVSKRRGSGGEK